MSQQAQQVDKKSTKEPPTPEAKAGMLNASHLPLLQHQQGSLTS